MPLSKVTRRTIHNARILLLLTISTVLIGCSSGEGLFDDYLTRLERTLETPIPPAKEVGLPTLPAQRDLQITIAESRMGLIDAWELNHCQLFSLIGERNSILGKLSEADVRFNYELRLLKSLPDCIADDETPEDARAMLQTLYENKQHQLLSVLWNATFAQADFRHLFSLSERTLKPDEPLDIPLYETTFTQLGQLADIESPVSSTVLTQSVKLASEFSLAGATLQSQKLAVIRLTQANAMLLNASENQTLCPSGLSLPELDIARNIMVNVFIARVQPWLVTVADAERASLTPAAKLASSFAENQKALLDPYFSEARNVNRMFRESIRLHTQRWQTLFDRCNQSATPVESSKGS